MLSRLYESCIAECLGFVKKWWNSAFYYLDLKSKTFTELHTSAFLEIRFPKIKLWTLPFLAYFQFPFYGDGFSNWLCYANNTHIFPKFVFVSPKLTTGIRLYASNGKVILNNAEEFSLTQKWGLVYCEKFCPDKEMLTIELAHSGLIFVRYY